MALSGTITTNHFSNSAVNETWMVFNWSATQDKDNNRSTVTWQVVAQRAGTTNWVKFYNVNINVNGNNYAPSGQYANGGEITKGSFTVNHDNEGHGSFSMSMSANVYYSSGNGAISASGVSWLDQIPRGLTSITNEVTSVGLNSVTIKWTCSPNRDHTQYSLNGGTWTDAGDTVATDNKSGNYTVSGLEPNTQYNIKTRLKRTDSQLWSTAPTTLYFTTKDMTKVTSWTQVTLPELKDDAYANINFVVNNPSGTSSRVYLERNNGGIAQYNCWIDNTASGNGTISIYKNTIETIYNQHANATASYNNDSNKRATSGMQLTTMTHGKETYYYVYPVTFVMTKANCGPTAIANMTIQEQNQDIGTLTGTYANNAFTSYTNGTNFIVVNGYSKVKVSMAANPLTTRAGASNKTVILGGSSSKNSTVATSHTITNFTGNNISVTAADTRGFSLQRTSSNFTVKTYKPVTISNFKINRENGMGKSAYLTFNGTYNPLNFGAVTNSIASVVLQVKEKSIAWGTGSAGASDGNIDKTKVNNYTITSMISKNTTSGALSCSNIVIKTSGTSGNNLIFEPGTEYDIRIIVKDQLTNKSSYSSQAIQATTSISSGNILFSAIKNKGVCFGTFYSGEVGGPLQVNQKEVLGSSVVSTWAN